MGNVGEVMSARLLVVVLLVTHASHTLSGSIEGKEPTTAGSDRELSDKEYRQLLLQLKKRRTHFLRENATLSHRRYDELFSGKCDQENTRNCWVLAALGAIPLEHREALFRTSIEKVGDAYAIRFPLGSSKAQIIRVTREDLAPQIVMENGKEKAYKPVKSSYGWQIMEAAFTLHQFGRDSKGQVNRQGSNGGRAHKALRELVPIRSESLEIIFHRSESLSSDETRRHAALRRFASYRPGISMYVASSLKENPPFKLAPKHAYVVQLIDNDSRQIMLINPHNSDRPLVLTYEQFLKGFRRLFCLEISLEDTFR